MEIYDIKREVSEWGFILIINILSVTRSLSRNGLSRNGRFWMPVILAVFDLRVYITVAIVTYLYSKSKN